MEEALRSNLFAIGTAYADAKSMTLHNVAALAALDYGFFSRLGRSEKTFTIRKYDRIMQWFSDNWPAELDWPSAINRPAPIKAVA